MTKRYGPARPKVDEKETLEKKLKRMERERTKALAVIRRGKAAMRKEMEEEVSEGNKQLIEMYSRRKATKQKKRKAGKNKRELLW